MLLLLEEGMTGYPEVMACYQEKMAILIHPPLKHNAW